MKKTIRDYDLAGKRVLIRVDFNVPLDGSKVLDDSRIKASIKTISYAIENGAKVILLSHLGRVKNECDKTKYNLKYVVSSLEKNLGKSVLFSEQTRGNELEEIVLRMHSGDVLLVQNTRYEDVPNNLESGCDEDLGKYWASLGDIFINDAFGTSHRRHASNVGVASNIPNGIGFLVEDEINTFNKLMTSEARPFTVILGGSKVSDKIEVINSLVLKADYILIGGGMAYTFLYASGINVGSSLLDLEHVSFCRDILKKYQNKIILPIDSVVSKSIDGKMDSHTCFINEIKSDEIGVDIGYNTVKLFKQYLSLSKTILWNGPVGIFEVDSFNKGTIGILDALKDIDALKVSGGGDTTSAIEKFGYHDAFTHISTGGGATLELLEGRILPGIEVIDEK